MSDVVIEADDTDTAVIVEAAVDAALADHKADMAVEDAAEALEVAEVALEVATATAHVCRCDEVEATLGARIAALETSVEDVAIAEVIDAATEAEVVEEETEPAPIKKEAPAEPEAAEEKPEAGRPGVSKSWFGAR